MPWPRPTNTGHFNRLFGQREALFDKIEAMSGGREALRALLRHDDAQVQLAIARRGLFAKSWPDAALPVLHALALRSDKIGADARDALEPEPLASSSMWWAEPDEGQSVVPLETMPGPPPSLAFAPAPRGVSKTSATQLIKDKMPARADALCALLRPALRLWPRKAAADPCASRFGGLPAVPQDFLWPFTHEEPLLFLAQINCAELGPWAKRFGLPAQGLLAFFGDHDDVNGCDATTGGEVLYMRDVAALRPAALPLGDFEPLIACGLSFFETYELPHAYEEVVGVLRFSEDEWSAYIDLRLELSMLAATDLCKERREITKLMDCWYDISKLFGWPDLIQYGSPGHIAEMIWRSPHPGERESSVIPDDRLLLQLGAYHDGTSSHDWGPGGLVYFMIAAKDLAAQRFDRAELAMQCS